MPLLEPVSSRPRLQGCRRWRLQPLLGLLLPCSSMSRWWVWSTLLWMGCACQKAPPADAPVRSVAQSPGLPTSPSHHPSRPVAVEPLAVCDARGLDALDAARSAYDAGEYTRALSCAA